MSGRHRFAGGVAGLAGEVARGACTARSLVDEALARIEARADLGAYVSVDAEGARAAAAAIDDRRVSGGRLGPLAGVPIAVKDNLLVAGLPTTCGSRLLASHLAPDDATAVSRLKAAGALIVGTTNLDEFGMGSSGEHSAHGPTRHPWLPDLVPGGSSSGSAAAVAAGTVPVALGTDTGGSVRQPAAFCGLVGLKPTYGRVSRYGLVAFASSLDSIGVLARRVADARLVLGLIAGPDRRDQTSRAPDAAPRPRGSLPARIGVPERGWLRLVDPAVAACHARAAATFAALGAELATIELPPLREVLAAYTVIAAAEAASNLARYDGVRYGARVRGDGGFAALVRATRSAGLGDEVVRRMVIGNYVLRAGYVDAYYRRALALRDRVTALFGRLLERVDAILMPTSPTPPFRCGERLADPVRMYECDLLTVPASLAGLPAISVPAGADQAGRPIGMQLIAAHWQEAALCELAARFEAARADDAGLPPAEGCR
jgi:aspartyl-tRNA(Asn)/glutamyl-tRNA(Gln) amidotransferase subunit A